MDSCQNYFSCAGAFHSSLNYKQRGQNMQMSWECSGAGWRMLTSSKIQSELKV